MNQFYIPTKVFFGEKSLDRLSKLPYKKALIIAEPFVVSSGMIDLLTSRLDTAGIRWMVYKDIVPDPPVESISAGVKALLDDRPDLLIAVGGGSALDSAKVMREISGNIEGSSFPYFVAIPTTSGTGSEVTSFSVITDVESHRKVPMISEHMLPDEAILDVDLVMSVPPSIIADTGMDVFTHALESYVSTRRNEFSAAMSEKAIELIRDFLIRSYKDSSDVRAKQKMHVASCMAGIAFNQTSLGLNHSIAHQLGAHFHIPHGRANAMLLPHIIHYNVGFEKSGLHCEDETLGHVQKYTNVAHLLDLPKYNCASVSMLCSWTIKMMRQMNMPTRMAETGTCSREEYFAAIPAMAQGALEDNCTLTNPRTPTAADITDILERLW